MCRLRDGDFTERSHFVGGRFENLYLDRDRIPELAILLEQSLRLAGAILERPPEQLRFGFWLNIMAPGDATSTHTHDESDELLSGVYYVVAPPDSGDLLIQDETASMRIAPRAGTLLFFPPSLAHGVAANRSAATRISVGLNIGPGRA
ncbi:putative 2OG-Fe(II) oxygenase [Thiocapsa imhoffii]|uniref:putative 2OG-Fe(II) oxygenase n=1 Tax=Thiocapsa imhoffii TaxID=382777 RepID=UPI001903A0CC